MDFDKIVHKMRKKGQKLWSLNDIEGYCETPTLTLPQREREGSSSKGTKQKAYKVIHRLISTGVLVSIRKGMYLWNMEAKLDPEDFYWPIAKKIIAENYLGHGIITGEKALAFGLRDYSLPEVLTIAVPKDGSKLAILGEYMLVANHIRTEKKSLYPLIKKYAMRVSFQDTDLLVTSPEHALLESLTTRAGTDVSDTALIERWLKKNAGSLRENVFAEFIPHRYISATNRLKYLASDLGMTNLYQMMLRLIDNQGKGCHLSRTFLSGKKTSKDKIQKTKDKM